MRSLVSLFLALSMSLVLASNAEAQMVGEVTAPQLNVRTGAGTGYERVAAFPRGRRLTILRSKRAANGRKWYLVEGRSTRGTQIKGYVSVAYVRVIAEEERGLDGPPGPVTPAPVTPAPALPRTPLIQTEGRIGTVTASSLAVRLGPTTAERSIGTVSKGTRVLIRDVTTTGDGTRWYVVTATARSGRPIRGFVSARHISTSAGVQDGTATPYRGARQTDPRLYDALVVKAAGRWGLDINLLRAVIQKESKFDPGATSPTGAAGVAQFTNIARAEVRRLLGFSKYSSKFSSEPELLAELKSFNRRRAYDPAYAIEGAALLLAQLLQKYGGNVEATLTHYNAGGKMGHYVKLYGHAGAKSRGLLDHSQARSYAPAVLRYKVKFDGGWIPEEFLRSDGISGALRDSR